MKKYILIVPILGCLLSCNRNKLNTDASGVFESEEVIISAQQSGQLLRFVVHEGDTLTEGQVVGNIDVSNIILQQAQVKATIQALEMKKTNPVPQRELVQRQLAVLQSQLEQQQREKTRTENLLRADAATQKQLDDINSSI